jgi:23S rRNA (guanosine2251-2'-O)-methyltransferase
VAAAVAAGRVTRLVVEAPRLRFPEIAGLVARAREQGVVVEIVDDVRPVAATDAPQGVVADARPIPWADLEEAVARTAPPALVVLDHLQDARNVGAIVRSAAAAGIRSLVVPTRRAAPLDATAFKAAAGAFEQMTVAGVSSVADAVARLRDAGVWAVGLDAAADRSLFGLDLLAEPVALVIGAEGTGLSRLVRDRLDVIASIPLAPGVESLNASVAAALAVFEVARVRSGIPGPRDGR